MLDVKKIRNNSDEILKFLSKKDKKVSLDNILKLDDSLKNLTTKLNELQADQNTKSKESLANILRAPFKSPVEATEYLLLRNCVSNALRIISSSSTTTIFSIATY